MSGEQHPGTYLQRGMLLHLQRRGLLPEADEDNIVVLEGDATVRAMAGFVRSYLRRTLQVAATLQHQRTPHAALQPPPHWGPNDT